MGFAAEDVIAFIHQRLAHDVACIQFYTAQKARILEKSDITAIAKRRSRLEIVLAVTVKRNHRKAEANKVIFTRAAEKEPPIRADFKVIAREQERRKKIRRMVLMETVFAAQQNSRMHGTQIINKLQFATKRERRKRI